MFQESDGHVTSKYGDHVINRERFKTLKKKKSQDISPALNVPSILCRKKVVAFAVTSIIAEHLSTVKLWIDQV